MLKIFLTIILISVSLEAMSKSVVLNDVSSLTMVRDVIRDQQPQKSDQVLVVFDIDDTLLKSDHFFGGDTWYNWQRGRAQNGIDGNNITIDDEDKITCLFSKLGTLYELGAYHPTETQATNVVATLQSRFDLMALTSRSPDYRGGTERELKRAGFDFLGAHLMDESKALAYLFNDGKSTRPVSYQNGIVMSTGLNKGEVLEDLLKRLDKTYSAIYFIDDSRKNIDNMDKKWNKSSTVMTIFHYTGVDKRVSPEDIKQGNEAGVAFDNFMNTAFPDRDRRFSEGNCQ